MKEQRDMSGILFKNDRKEKETHPDYQGDCKIDGVDYYMSAWLKTGKKGKFMSFAFKKKDKTEKDMNSVRPENTDMSDIPF